MIQQDSGESPLAKYSSNICIFYFILLKVCFFQMTTYFVYLLRYFKRDLLFQQSTEEQWTRGRVICDCIHRSAHACVSR